MKFIIEAGRYNYGPFNTASEAVKWAMLMFGGSVWRLAPLEAPRKGKRK